MSAAHTLVITVDEKHLAAARAQDPGYEEREAWDHTIRCPHDGVLTSERYCWVWAECGCELTDEQIDDLHNDGEGPCPKSPTGKHQWLCTEDLNGPGHPIDACWLREDPDMCEMIEELITRENLVPGEHLIDADIHSDYTELSLHREAKTAGAR